MPRTPPSEEVDQELFDLLLGEKHKPCKTAETLAALPEGSRVVVEQAIAAGAAPHAIVAALRKRGLPTVEQSTLRKHVNGQCSCPRI